MTTETPTAAASSPQHRLDGRRRSGTAALAVACAIVLSAGCRDGGVASAFSPPHRISTPMTRVRHDVGDGRNGIAAFSSARRTRLAYKHFEESDASDVERYDVHAKNETALGDGGSVEVNADVTVEIRRDVIYFNDLDDEPSLEVSDSSSDDAGFAVQASSGDDGEGEDLIHELESAIQEKNVNLRDDEDEAVVPEDASPITPPKLKAIEPSQVKPAKKFESPIQLIKKVPKVEPIHMSTVFFLKLIGDPGWTDGSGSGSKRDGPNEMKPEAKPETKKPTVKNWKTQMDERRRKGSTAFRAASYLESLGAAETKNDRKKKDEKDDNIMKALREQQAQRRREQQEAQQNAIYEANRRTNPKDVIDKRIEEGEKRRKRKERERLERLYVERKERIDAKKRDEQRYLEERERQEEVQEGKALERSEAEAAASDAADKEEIGKGGKKVQLTSKNGKRGVPILDRPNFDAAPLLIGSTLTIRYSDLTPSQKRAVKLAREYRLKMAGEAGGVPAAPVIAVVDGYTAAATRALRPHPREAPRRYATLASVEVEGAVDGTPSAVKLTGARRAFLHDYFSSSDDAGTERDDMAEFDLALDEPPAIPLDGRWSAEPRRRANDAYRLHEERKKLVSTLRAGEARLRLGKGRSVSADASCLVEFDDCDGAGGGGLVVVLEEEEEESPDVAPPPPGDAPRCRLETLENYGLGSYGAISTVPDLAGRLSLRLEPYYARAHREGEEYEAEMASFAVLRSLEAYASPSEVAAALVAPGPATRRLEAAREIMARHRDELEELVERISRELCGDECTGSW